MALQFADSFTGTGVRHDLGANDNLYVSAGIRSISTDDTAIEGIGAVHSVHIYGTVFGTAAGVSISSDFATGLAGGNAVVIGKTGQLSSEGRTILLTGMNNTVLNYGEILSLTSSAITFGNGGDGTNPSKVINRGSISADGDAISAGGNPVLVRNFGDITSSYGAAISTGIGDDKVQNYGTLDGDVKLFDGFNTVINRGLIVGNVTTGLNGDTMDNRGGTITGDIMLGAGNDIFIPGAENETVNGGADRDILDFSRSGGVQFALDGSLLATGAASGDTYLNFESLIGSLTGADVLTGDNLSNYLGGNGGNDVLSGLGGDDTMVGGFGNDTLDAGSGVDDLYGEAGDDILFGNSGSDTISGGDGADTITGGAAKDRVGGGHGADRFVFGTGDFGGKTSTTADIISDFTQADADRIDLRLVDASSRTTGDQAFVFIGTAAFGSVAGQLRYAQAGGSTYVQGDTNGDGVADFWIGLLGSIALKATDFML